MARPTQYNLDKVLDDAMDIFWQKGFAGVTMADIVEHTGLNRRTMYSLFEDKEGLFKNALDRYYHKRGQFQLSILKENAGKKGIEMIFNRFKFGEKNKGCLFSNSMREKDFMLAETYKIPKSYFDTVLVQLEKNLNEAAQMKEFSGNVRAMALMIITFIHGFHVVGKYNKSEEDGKALIENLLNMIR